MEPEYLQVVGFLNSFQKITSSVLWKYTSAYFNQCDGVVSPSEISKQDLINHGITRGIHIIHNSINPEQIRLVADKKVQEIKLKLGLKKNVILYVGRISIEKNLDQLIKSFRLVLKQQPECSLCIVGKGPATKSLKELVGRLRLTKNVIFLGEIQQDPLLSEGYYQMADMFATASISELQPVSIIEAFAFGLPLVGSAKRGTEEMIKNVGLLARPNDIKGFAENMLKILTDSKMKTILQKKSMEAYKTQYYLETTTKEYENECLHPRFGLYNGYWSNVPLSITRHICLDLWKVGDAQRL